MDEREKERIQQYIDGRLDENQKQVVESLVKSDREAQRYYKGLIAVQRKVKRLESRSAFLHFAERWPRRVRSEHEKRQVRRRIIRTASSMAALALVALVGFSVYRSDFSNMGAMSESVMEKDANMLAVSEEDQAVMMDEAVAEESIDEREAPEAPSAEEAGFAGDAAITEDTMSEQAEDNDKKALPDNALIIADSEGNAQDFFDAMVSLTEGQQAQPERVENQVWLLITEENSETILAFLDGKSIPHEGLEKGMMLVMEFTE